MVGRAGHLRQEVKVQTWIPTGSYQPGENQREGRFKGLSSPAAYSPEKCSSQYSLNTTFVSESIDAEDQTGFITSRLGAAVGELQPRLQSVSFANEPKELNIGRKKPGNLKKLFI